MRKLKDLNDCKEALEQLKIAEKTLNDVTEEEQISFDCLPENMQWGSRGDVFKDNLDNLNDAQVDLGMIVEAYENADENPYKSVKKEIASVIKDCTEAIERR